MQPLSRTDSRAARGALGVSVRSASADLPTQKPASHVARCRRRPPPPPQVKKNLLDGVPKAAMYFLVNRIKANLQKQLLAELYTDYTFSRCGKAGRGSAHNLSALSELATFGHHLTLRAPG